MDDKENKLDELYREKFDKFELPVSEQLLASIKQQAGIGASKNKIAYWKWMLSAFLFTGVAMSIYFMTSDNKKNKFTQGTIELQKQTTNASESGSQTEINKHKQNNVTSKKITEEIQERKTTHEITQTIEKAEPKKTIAAATNTNTISNISEKGKAIAKTASTKKPNAKKEIRAKKDENRIENKNATNAVNVSESKNNSAKLNNSTNETQSVSVSESLLKRQETIISKNETPAKDSIIPQTDSAQITKSDKEDSLTKTVANKADEIPATKTSKPICFFVELNGGPSLSFRTLSSSNSIDLANRNSNEKQQWNYTADINFGICIKNKLNVSVGIGVDNKGQKNSILGRSAKYDTAYVLDTLHGANFYDTILTQTQSEIKAVDTKNKQQYLKIPISISYQFNIKEKFFFAPVVGLNINYLLTANAIWLETKEGSPILGKTENTVSYIKSDDVYSKWVFSGKFGLAIGVNITNKFSINIQPAYNRYFQSIYKSSFGFKEIPYSYDFNLGIKYKF